MSIAEAGHPEIFNSAAQGTIVSRIEITASLADSIDISIVTGDGVLTSRVASRTAVS